MRASTAPIGFGVAESSRQLVSFTPSDQAETCRTRSSIVGSLSDDVWRQRSKLRPPTGGTISAMNGISVVICTYDGAGRLPQCLDALSKCAFGSGGEVVVVDNGSTDDSAVVAASHWATIDSAPVPLRIVKEAKNGRAWARRAGAQAAQYDLLIYCDDDNLLDPDYVSAAIELMRDPEVGAASGVARPVSSAAFPAWFYTFADDYSVGCQARWPEVFGELDIDMTPFEHRCPWGAGLVVRRQDLLKVLMPQLPAAGGSRWHSPWRRRGL